MSSERLVGVLMTGMGNDGARSMAALRAAGGRTIAESGRHRRRLGHAGRTGEGGRRRCRGALEAIAGKIREMVRAG